MVKSFFNRKMNFFSDNLVRMADYLKSEFPEQAAHAVSIGDSACNNSFLFDPRRNIGRSAEPVTFKGAIDWLYQPADDEEWIYAFNRHQYFICLGQSFVLTGDEKYAECFVSHAVDWIRRIGINNSDNAKAWRTIDAGFRLENWLKGLCFFEKSQSVPDSFLEVFFGSVIEHAEYLMREYDTFRLMSNWGVIQNRGLFMAGVMLPETKRTRDYVKVALQRLTEEINIQIYRDGVHWEQSPMYHVEVLHCFLDVIFIGIRNGIVLPEDILNKTRQMCRVVLFSQKPDHHGPMQGDSDRLDFRNILTKGAYVFSDSFLKSGAHDRFDFEISCEFGYRAKTEYDKIGAEKPAQVSFACSDSGNYYLRSGWEPESNYMRFHCGTLGAGHGHSDKLHVDLFANGEDILVDAGRFTYVDCPERYFFKDPPAHNTVIVDGSFFTVCKDSWECSKLSQPVNRSHYFSQEYDFLQGGHLGYMDIGVFHNRKIVYIKPDIYIIADEFYTSGRHRYTQFFNFNNTGFFNTDESIIYTGAGNITELIYLTPDIEIRTEASKMSREYNSFEENSVLVSDLQGSGPCSILMVISTSSSQGFEKLEAEKIPVESNFKGTVFPDFQIEALAVTKGCRKYTVVIAHQEYASPTDTFNANGCVGFGNVVVFNNTSEKKAGSVLLW
ncbi:MAG: alginate lyase family protein [Spirochaetes bacterium]|nr:alginate lyase family protein [Spirochaetota bacterium]